MAQTRKLSYDDGLHFEYVDGTSQVIGSDSTWKATIGPMKSGLYHFQIQRPVIARDPQEIRQLSAN